MRGWNAEDAHKLAAKRQLKKVLRRIKEIANEGKSRIYEPNERLMESVKEALVNHGFTVEQKEYIGGYLIKW